MTEYRSSENVRKYAAYGLWTPIVAAGVSAAGVMLAAVYRYAMFGETPPVGFIAGIDGQTQMALIAAVALAYWGLYNYTFGEDVIDTTMDQADEARDIVENNDSDEEEIET